jgi:GT2 family glycosyltransferase
MMRAWLVVLSWNGRDDTLALLDSLAAAELGDTTVLVVDNGSSDGTLQAVQRAHPWVRTLQNGQNLGYAAGNNRGIDLAISEGAQVVGVLNNDTLVEPDFWLPLVETAATGLIAVSPLILYADDVDTVWFFGARFSVDDATPSHLDESRRPAQRGLPSSDLLSGCCLVASTSIWQVVGGFDERMFLIFEDCDWSMRARRAGIQLRLQPASRVRHKVSRSFADQHLLGLYYFCRNGVTFNRRWHGWRSALRFATQHVLRIGLRGVRHRRPGSVRGLAVRLVGLVAGAAGAGGPAGSLARSVAQA